jgi:probable rRNA maturation factor
MIAIEHAPSKQLPVGSAIRKRELAHFLACAARTIGIQGEVSVLLTDDERIRELNREFRNKDKPTDVLSFPVASHFATSGQAGDLAISLETAARQATDRGHALLVEIKILLLHGLLHLAGYDHENDSGQMARQEALLRRELNLPLGLIERAKAEKPMRNTPAKSTKGKGPPAATTPARSQKRLRGGRP